MPAAPALQPAQPAGIVIRWDKRPLYSDDAPAILRLEEALIKGGMTAPAAKLYVSSLLSFSRWLFAKNRPSIVARMDSKSLSDGGDIHEFTGGGNKRLFKALEHLRTFRSTGVAVPVVRPGRAGAELNPPPQNAALINPEDAVLMEPRRVDAAAAQHSAPQEAGSRPQELQGRWDDQPAPSAFGQEHVAFDAQQISPEELVLDHLDDQSLPSPASLPSEQLERLEKELHNELHGRGDNHPVQSFSGDPEQFTFNPEQFSPGELERLLDDQADESSIMADPEQLRPLEEGLREELQGSGDDELAHSFVSVGSEVLALSEQSPPAKIRRVINHMDDQSMPSPASVDPTELQRLQEQLHNEIHQPGRSFSVDPEDFTFNPEQFSPGELERLLDAIPSPVPAGPEDFALNPEQFPAKELWHLLNDEPAQLGMASSSGPANQSAYELNPLPNLSMYLPPDFQHGPQRASEDFMQGMRLHNLLPSASQPETKFPLGGVNYTATLEEDQIFLRPT
ncbi:hypothetical protein [Bradyrhizobium lablabi]|uniref:hypothetical protein n=1 Tax=Bradyrhizobium lablabi TaxID=722472 RepID=UPI001FD91729|nr:hypothetical protein [Bradyrhizobium lablabi]